MSYPASVDTGQVAPFTLIPDGAASSSGASAITAGAAFAYAITLTAQITIAQMRTQLSGTPTGNVDMGIYDSTGTNGLPNNLLAHTGAILSATGLFTKSLLQAITLSPGIYWLALLDTVADSFFNRNTTNTGVVPAIRTTATTLTVLGTPFGASSNNGLIFMIEALQSGAWS